MNCQHRMGLLILRECGEPVSGYCGSCGTALCAAHLGGGICAVCSVTSGDRNENDWTREEGMRRDYYGSFGGAGYFNAADRESLRPSAWGMAAGAGATDDYDPFET